VFFMISSGVGSKQRAGFAAKMALRKRLLL